MGIIATIMQQRDFVIVSRNGMVQLGLFKSCEHKTAQKEHS
jgi:hypothetical protein